MQIVIMNLVPLCDLCVIDDTFTNNRGESACATHSKRIRTCKSLEQSPGRGGYCLGVVGGGSRSRPVDSLLTPYHGGEPANRSDEPNSKSNG